MQQEHEHVLAVTTQRLQTRLEDEHKQNMHQRDKDSQVIFWVVQRRVYKRIGHSVVDRHI